MNSFDTKHIWHPYSPTPQDNIVIVKAEGCSLFTADGKEIIDAVSSWWVNIHGHCNKIISEAIAKQANTLEHVIFAGFTHQPAIDLSQKLIEILPGKMDKIFFSDDGSTAVEAALKMAIQYWQNKGISGRTKIIAIEGSYHGDTFGAMSVGQRSAFTKPFNSYLFDVKFIKFPFETNEKEVIEQFATLIEAGDVAAFIYEPLIQGVAGMRTYGEDVLNQLLLRSSKAGVINIADEVMTGFGRTGRNFASDYINTPPDIICLSKGITGGYMPLGVTACNRLVSHQFEGDDAGRMFFHGHSYTANPLACAAANTSLDILLSSPCQTSIQNINRRHFDYAKKLQNHPAVFKIHHIGTILSIEIKTNSSAAYFNDIRTTIYSYFLERNILLRPLGNVLYILPPYIISDNELTLIYDSILQFLDEYHHKNL